MVAEGGAPQVEALPDPGSLSVVPSSGDGVSLLLLDTIEPGAANVVGCSFSCISPSIDDQFDRLEPEASSDDDSAFVPSCSTYSYDPADFPRENEIEEFRAPSYCSCTTESSTESSFMSPTPISVVARSTEAIQSPNSYRRGLQKKLSIFQRILGVAGLKDVVSQLDQEKPHAVSENQLTEKAHKEQLLKGDEKNRAKDSARLSRGIPGAAVAELLAVGWPHWLASAAGEAVRGWVPRSDTFEKLDIICRGTPGFCVYKARNHLTGQLVALKEVRNNKWDPESVCCIAREIVILRRLSHPNVAKLKGLVTSKMPPSLYLVFECMEHDLATLASTPGIKFTEARVKCYMQQMLRGLDYCHRQGILHRDLKGSDLLIDNSGILKIADFSWATFYNGDRAESLTSQVGSIRYRAPELLLGATTYGVSVDLWSTGCIFAELCSGKPIMTGRTELEQLHKIFKLCGSPPEEFWRDYKSSYATIVKPQQPYRNCVSKRFKSFPASALALLEALLSIQPTDRGTAASALTSEYFTTGPLPCDPYAARVRDNETRRLSARKFQKGIGRITTKDQASPYVSTGKETFYSGPLVPMELGMTWAPSPSTP